MRNANFVAIPVTAVTGTDTAESAAIDAQQVVGISAQAITTSTAAGTLQVQVSNDVPPAGYQPGGSTFAPTNYTDLLATPITVAAGSTAIVPFQNAAYRWMRVVYVNTAGSGNVSVNVNVIGLN
jgi:hypothetical protein